MTIHDDPTVETPGELDEATCEMTREEADAVVREPLVHATRAPRSPEDTRRGLPLRNLRDARSALDKRPPTEDLARPS
jgi:hypothetical protein